MRISINVTNSTLIEGHFQNGVWNSPSLYSPFKLRWAAGHQGTISLCGIEITAQGASGWSSYLTLTNAHHFCHQIFIIRYKYTHLNFGLKVQLVALPVWWSFFSTNLIFSYSSSFMMLTALENLDFWPLWTIQIGEGRWSPYLTLTNALNLDLIQFNLKSNSPFDKCV